MNIIKTIRLGSKNSTNRLKRKCYLVKVIKEGIFTSGKEGIFTNFYVTKGPCPKVKYQNILITDIILFWGNFVSDDQLVFFILTINL